MRILFIHQNFPGQFGRLAATLAKKPDWQVVALGDQGNITNRRRIPGVRLGAYPAPAAPDAHTHHYVRPLAGAVVRGQAVAKACLELKKRGFSPDVIYAHPGWGEALFLKDVFPEARLTLYCEFYYHSSGRDVGFDPEFPLSLDDVFRVRIKNAASLLSLTACNAGISASQWQRSTFPKEFRNRITVIHEGVDTELVRPDTSAELLLNNGNLKLTSADEVVTYVARNLEPYRGFHVLMRALPAIQRLRPRAHVIIVGGEGVSYGVPLPGGQTYKKKMLDEVGAGLDMSRVHFLGLVPYATLLRIYQISSAHVYFTYPFVLSWSLLEAMSAGCAVIASRTAPVEEVITNGKNGYLVDFFDSAAFAARVDEVLGSKDKGAAIRERARRLMISRFDLRTICLPRHLELLGLKAAKQPSGSSDGGTSRKK